MTWRFPDKPVDSGPGILAELKDGEWLCQMKHDGWRCVVEVVEESAPALGLVRRTVTLTSRHRQPIPVHRVMQRQLLDVLLGDVEAPPGTIIDAEWMGRRNGQPESLVLFDLLAWAGEWIGEHPAEQRYERLRALVEGCGAPWIWLVECRTRGYAAMFEDCKKCTGVEGLVLKHVSSRYIGSTRRSVDNPLWLKVRWRAGEDGRTRLASVVLDPSLSYQPA